MEMDHNSQVLHEHTYIHMKHQTFYLNRWSVDSNSGNLQEKEIQLN